MAPLAFDASTFEIWGALLNGGMVAILPDDWPSLDRMAEAISAYRATTLWLTAGLFHLFVDDRIDALRPLRQLLAGGDVLSPPHVKRVLNELPGCRLINGYGPTENTTFTCCYTISGSDWCGGPVPIGEPIAHTSVRILDDLMQPVADGDAGQLCAGGDGLALGDLNRPELTAEKFVRDPFSQDPQARLYLTGDVVRRRPDGVIEFLGRNDRQIKIDGKRANHNDVVLAVPTAAQSLVEDQILVGHCVNFLPMRVPFNPAAPFADHLKAANDHLLAAYDHQVFTLGTLVRKLEIKRDQSRLPLTDVPFNLEKVGHGIDFAGLACRMTPNPKACTNFDLFLNMIESNDGIRIDVDDNTGVFDRSTLARWIGHLRTLLAGIAQDPMQPIEKLPVLSAAERGWLLRDLNATACAYPHETSVDAMIEAQVARTPNAIATVFGDTSLTYRQLDEAANRLARHLLTIVPRRAGAPASGARIAIAADRSFDMLIALLAVMKTGHAYVPLDPAHPHARLMSTLERADVSAIICSAQPMASIAPAGVPAVVPDAERALIRAYSSQPLDRADPMTSAERAAYVIFTSGSTGAPKGVEVSHRSVVNFLNSMAQRPGLTANDTPIAVTTISFDIAALELFLPLTAGARVVIASRDEVRDVFGWSSASNRRVAARRRRRRRCGACCWKPASGRGQRSRCPAAASRCHASLPTRC